MQATAAIDRILTVPSELLDLWTESDETDAWKAPLAALKQRLS